MAAGLSNLTAPQGANRKRKRVGRGESSGWGKTSTRGHKGQKARKSGHTRVGFEGGQMPMQRRMPKRGFKNPFRREYAPINVRDLQRFEANSVVEPEALAAAGLVKLTAFAGVKILGDGALDRALTVRAHRFSESARQKIEAAGGTVEILG